MWNISLYCTIYKSNLGYFCRRYLCKNFLIGLRLVLCKHAWQYIPCLVLCNNDGFKTNVCRCLHIIINIYLLINDNSGFYPNKRRMFFLTCCSRTRVDLKFYPASSWACIVVSMIFCWNGTAKLILVCQEIFRARPYFNWGKGD